MSKPVVGHHLEVVRLVVRRVVPLAPVDGRGTAVFHFALEAARPCIRDPAVQFSDIPASHHLHAPGAAEGADQFIRKVRIHLQDGAALIVDKVLDLLVVNLCGEFHRAARHRSVETRSRLPAALRKDIGVTHLPVVVGRDVYAVRDLVDELRHGIESRLGGKMVRKGVFSGDAHLGRVIHLAVRSVFIIVHVTQAGIEAGGVGQGPLVAGVDCRFDGTFRIEHVGIHDGRVTVRQIRAGAKVVMGGRNAVGKGVV